MPHPLYLKKELILVTWKGFILGIYSAQGSSIQNLDQTFSCLDRLVQGEELNGDQPWPWPHNTHSILTLNSQYVMKSNDQIN